MKFETSFPPEFWKQFENLKNIDTIAPKMLQTAAPIAVSAIKKRLEKHRDTGQLIDSVKAGKPKKGKKGGYVLGINFVGYDKLRKPTPSQPKGVSNAVKAAGIEYGNAHQPARPFMSAAAKDCEQETVETMQQVFNVEVAIRGSG